MAESFTSMLARKLLEWIPTRGEHDGEVKRVLVKALQSDAYNARSLGLGPIWKLHVRLADQADGDSPLVTIMLTDAERRDLIRGLGGRMEDA